MSNYHSMMRPSQSFAILAILGCAVAQSGPMFDYPGTLPGYKDLHGCVQSCFSYLGGPEEKVDCHTNTCLCRPDIFVQAQDNSRSCVQDKCGNNQVDIDSGKDLLRIYCNKKGFANLPTSAASAPTPTSDASGAAVSTTPPAVKSQTDNQQSAVPSSTTINTTNTTPASSSSTSVATSNSSSNAASGSSSVSNAELAGAIVGGISALVAIISLIYIIVHKQRKKNNKDKNHQQQELESMQRRPNPQTYSETPPHPQLWPQAQSYPHSQSQHPALNNIRYR